MVTMRKYFVLSLLIVSSALHAGRPGDSDYIKDQSGAPAEEFYFTSFATGILTGALLGTGIKAFDARPDIAQTAFTAGVGGVGSSGLVYSMRSKDNPGRQQASMVTSVAYSVIGNGVGLAGTMIILGLLGKR